MNIWIADCGLRIADWRTRHPIASPAHFQWQQFATGNRAFRLSHNPQSSTGNPQWKATARSWNNTKMHNTLCLSLALPGNPQSAIGNPQLTVCPGLS